MMEVELLWKGLLAGIAIAAPVGPVNVLVISRAIEKGWKSGLLAGAGAALADTFYGSIAGFSISFVINFLIREQRPLKIAGGFLLMAIAVVYSVRKPHMPNRSDSADAAHSDFVSALLLNLTNPTTVLSFLVVLGALGMDGNRPIWLNSLLVAGIAVGSMAWWIFLITIGSRLRDRFNDAAMLRMNRIAAVAIGGFGIFTLLSGWFTRK